MELYLKQSHSINYFFVFIVLLVGIITMSIISVILIIINILFIQKVIEKLSFLLTDDEEGYLLQIFTFNFTGGPVTSGLIPIIKGTIKSAFGANGASVITRRME